MVRDIFSAQMKKKKCSGSFACDRSTAAPNVKYFVNALDRLIESPTSKACTWPLTCFVHNSTVWTWPSNLNSFKSSPKLSRAIFFFGCASPRPVPSSRGPEVTRWKWKNVRLSSVPHLLGQVPHQQFFFFFFLLPSRWEMSERYREAKKKINSTRTVR